MSNIDHILDNEIFIEKLEALFLKKFEDNPKDIHNLIQLAETNRKKGNLEAASSFYEKVLSINPDHSEAKWVADILNGNELTYTQPADDIIPSPFCIIDNFLSEEKLTMLDAIIEKNSNLFESSKVVDNKESKIDRTYRKSKTLNHTHFTEFAKIFYSELVKILPGITSKLNIELSPADHPELLLTMHLDGDFLKIHKDILPPDSGIGSSRKLTYVFYHHSKPKRFDGGDLLLFDTDKEGNQHSLNYTKVSPVRNSIIFFPSHCFHKVTAIKLLTDNELEGRYTINGWFHS